MTKDKSAKPGDPVIIKKYANRRLYNTQSSSYITLDHLAKMIREEVEFQVIDAKTGVDITHTILTQIIMDEEAGGEQMLPTSFLRQLISMYGNSMQALVPSYLENAMEQFRSNQAKLRKTIEDSLGTNPLVKAAAFALRPGGRSTSSEGEGKAAAKAAAVTKSEKSDKGGKTGKAEADAGARTEAAPDGNQDQAGGSNDEIAALRAQMAEMQKKLDTLSK